MTVCVTSGFSKFKRYVGNNYACDGSDLPATQDFGTDQYQGPSQTTLAVPSTTVSYTIIGKASCGNSVKDIRRITTKTYSLRVGAYTCTSPIGGTLLAGTPSELWALFYATIPNIASRVAWNICPAYTGSNVIYYYNDAVTYGPPAGDGDIIVYGNYMQTSVAGNTLTCADIAARELVSPLVGYYRAGWEVITANYDANYYYLDINEVWTYDLI